MADTSVAITAGSGTPIDTRTDRNGHHRQVVQVGDYGGGAFAASTFRTLGRAGTAGQKIFALHNATASPVDVALRKLEISMYCTVIKAVTVAPPMVKAWKFTAVPTNGTVLTKVPLDSGATASNASVTAWGDASADGTGSGTTLTVTLPAGTFVDAHFVPRVITAVGEINTYESMNLLPTSHGGHPDLVLNPLEGICVFLDYVLATQNPVTDMWSVNCVWEEFTP